MKILQLGSFTVLTVLVFTKAAFAVGVSASVVTTAEARSESTIIDIDQDAQSGSVIASAAAFAFEENARAQASATARAVAVLGDISLSGDAQSVGQLGLEAAVGGLGEGIGHARAKQEDNLRLNTFSVPVGDQVIVLAKLKISGFVAGRATTAPEIFRPPLPSFPADAGQYFGEVNIGASAGVFFKDANDAGTQLFGFLGGTCKGYCASGDYDIPVPDTVYWNFGMPAGQRIPFFYEFVIDYKARGGGRVDAFIAADFSGSIHWGGIERVVNATTGEVLQDWTIESESGFDYSRSFEAQVPEPTSMLLLTASLFALVGLHRWR